MGVIPRVCSQPAGAAEKPVEMCYKAGKAAAGGEGQTGRKDHRSGGIFLAHLCAGFSRRASELLG